MERKYSQCFNREYIALQTIAYKILKTISVNNSKEYIPKQKAFIKQSLAYEKDYLFKYNFYKAITNIILNINSEYLFDYTTLDQETENEMTKNIMLLEKIIDLLQKICGFYIRKYFFPEMIILSNDFKSTYFLLYFLDLLTDKIFSKDKEKKKQFDDIKFVEYLFAKIYSLEKNKIIEETTNMVDVFNCYFTRKKYQQIKSNRIFSKYLDKIKK